jgi:hypothetical protein
MRGTVAKRFRKQAQYSRDEMAYLYERLYEDLRSAGVDEDTIQRKYYRRIKFLHKLWRRLPFCMGSF